MRDDDTFRLPDDDELLARAAELRREWQSDEEEWSRAALEHFRHQRTLVDVLREAMRRGDVVVVGDDAGAPRGLVVHVGDDWCRIDTPAGPVEVPLDAPGPVVRIAERSRIGGCSGDACAPSTWRARLLELETAGAVCVVELTSGEMRRGRLRVGGDHVAVVEGDDEIYVPNASVSRIRVTGAAAPRPGC